MISRGPSALSTLSKAITLVINKRRARLRLPILIRTKCWGNCWNALACEPFMGPEEVNAITGQWDYRTLPANVRLGPGCYLERRESFKRFRSTRAPGLILGEGVTVYTWTEFNVEPTGVLEVG